MFVYQRVYDEDVEFGSCGAFIGFHEISWEVMAIQTADFDAKNGPDMAT